MGLMGMGFVALDVETANRSRGSICSIGMVKMADGKIVDRFYSLIDPETYFDKMNIAIHGIRRDHVLHAPTFEGIYHDMLSFIDNNLLLAHNTSFDMYALNDAFKKYNLDIPELDYLCTYRLSQALYKLPSYRLNMMAEHFNIDNSNHHHALNDALVCASIALEIAKDKNQDLINICEASKFELGNLRRNGFVKKRAYKNSYK